MQKDSPRDVHYEAMKTMEKPSKTEARKKPKGQAAKIWSKFLLLTSPWGRPAKSIEAFFESQECGFALMQSRRFKLCQKKIKTAKICTSNA